MVLLKSTAGLSEATCQQLLLDMDTYKRPQLQELCKMAKVSAGGSNEEMRRRLSTYAYETYGMLNSQEVPAKQSSLSSKVSALREKVSSLRSNPSRVDESFDVVEPMPMSEPEIAAAQPSPIRTSSTFAYPGWPEDATVASIERADTSDMTVDPANISDASTQADESLPGSFEPAPVQQIRRVVSKPLSALTSNLTPISSKAAASTVFGITSTPNDYPSMPLSPPAFVFGTPQAAPAFNFAHRASEAMQEKIMSEVNRRVATEGVKIGPSYERLYGPTEVLRDDKDEGRFAEVHRKHFDQMESIASSYKAKRKLDDENNTMKRTASSSSLFDRASKKLKIGSGSSKVGFQAKVADGLREEGWAEDDGKPKKVKLWDDEAKKRAMRKRGSLGGRRKSIPKHQPRSWGAKLLTKVKSAVTKQEPQPLPAKAIYWHPAMPEEGNLPRFALPTSASAAKVAESVRARPRDASGASQPERSNIRVVSSQSQLNGADSPEKRQAQAQKKRNALIEAQNNVKVSMRSPNRVNTSTPRKVRSSAQTSARKPPGSAVGLGRPGWR